MKRFYLFLGAALLAALAAVLWIEHSTIVNLRPYWVDSSPGWNAFYGEHLTLWEYRFVIVLALCLGLPAVAALIHARTHK